MKIAELYRGRWTIETAFQHLADHLNSEINTLGYPRAALFGFCVALVSYIVVSVIKAALGSVHGIDIIENTSTPEARKNNNQNEKAVRIALMWLLPDYLLKEKKEYYLERDAPPCKSLNSPSKKTDDLKKCCKNCEVISPIHSTPLSLYFSYRSIICSFLSSLPAS